MIEQRIKAEHVELAAVTAKMLRRNSTLGRFAAIARQQVSIATCADLGRMGKPWANASVLCPGFIPMDRGYIRRCFERTRRERGLHEVRRTWGAGIRALMSEPLTLRGQR